jgi:hypothetical protein
MSACDKTENFELPEPSVFGDWMEVEPEGLGQFEGSTYLSLLLKEDNTFQLYYKAWSDILRVDDPCLGVQDYYVKGTFSVDPDFIYFEGCFSDESFVNCMARCDGNTTFRETYQYIFSSDSLILNPKSHPIERRVLLPRS